MQKESVLRVAVIGSGIAGNIAARALVRDHDVILYEKRERPGGHSATVDVDYDGVSIAVDTGFIVYNTLNYPNLTALFDFLGVDTEQSDMSFAVSDRRRGLEWGGDNLNAVFAQRRNLVSPRFLSMLMEMLRFNRCPVRDRRAGRLAGLTLREYLAWQRFSQGFWSNYLVPMGAAIWSMPAEETLGFPAESFVAFFENHGLLSFNQPIWRTVTGGSRTYVKRLLQPLGAGVRLGAPVVGVRRGSQITVRDATGAEDRFDHVVIAAHSDQALTMLVDASPRERAILGAVRYRPNTVYLHRDARLMPRLRRVWSSWNFIAGDRPATRDAGVEVSYWMNRLQNIDRAYPIFITLNPDKPPDPDLTFDVFEYDHPQFDMAALQAQRALDEIQGDRNTWFCGAWCGYGFHEDGIAAGLAVASRLGSVAPWINDIAPRQRVSDTRPVAQPAGAMGAAS